jgi:MSHA pilin protein MshC
MRQQTAGFTLIELVVVMIVAAILLVSAGGRFFSISDVSPYQLRDQLIGQLRQLQTRSMQDVAGLKTRCPVLVLSATASGLATSNSCQTSASFSLDSNDVNQLSFGDAQVSVSTGSLPQLFRFDSWGRPVAYDASLNSSFICSSGCTISISQSGSTANLCVSSSGYINAC